MKCVNCKYFKVGKEKGIFGHEFNSFYCTNPETFQTTGTWWQDGKSIGAYDFKEPFYVGDNFGCVNFEQAEEPEIEDEFEGDEFEDDLDESVDGRQSHGNIVKELMHKYKKSGKIGNTKPEDTEHAEEIANAIAYKEKNESLSLLINRLRKIIEE